MPNVEKKRIQVNNRTKGKRWNSSLNINVILNPSYEVKKKKPCDNKISIQI